MKEQFMAEAERRLRSILQSFSEAGDVAPALGFRTEGFFEAGVFLGLVKEQQLSALIERLQKEVLDIEDQRIFTERLSIPVLMRRAPVMPSS